MSEHPFCFFFVCIRKCQSHTGWFFFSGFLPIAIRILSACLSEKILGPAGSQVFIFCSQNKYSGRQKLYLRINGFSFAKDNRLSLVYVFAKKKVTYLGGQVGDQAWKFSRHWVKTGCIGDPTGCNIEPWFSDFFLCKFVSPSLPPIILVNVCKISRLEELYLC